MNRSKRSVIWPGLTLVFLAPIALLALFGTAADAARPAPQHLVFVMADDVGVGDVGWFHHKRTGREPLAPTPQLDALVEAGMRFTDAHATTALCSPTRYGVMSGNLTYRSYAPWGVWQSFRPSPFIDRDTTIGRVGRSAGMRTAFLGKWHLGGDFRRASGEGVYRGNDHGADPTKVDASRIIGGGPSQAGFDYSFTLPCGVQGPCYVAYENDAWSPFAKDSRLIHYTAETAADPRYVSDKGPGVGDSAWNPRLIGPLLSEKARGFLGRTLDAGERLLLCYWSAAVHLPHTPPDRFDGKQVAGATPTSHLDMMIDLDQQVGRLVAELKSRGAWEDTLFVFTSDNGALVDRPAERLGHQGSDGLRGSKNTPYAGGHRVPMIVVWPRAVEAGSVCDAPVAVHDVVATFASATGQTLRSDQAMDSLDLMPILRGEGDPTTDRPDFLLQGGSRHEVVYRQGPWKLIIQSDAKLSFWEPIALFNLAENPTEDESQNLVDASEQADRVAAMLVRYIDIRESGRRTVPHPGSGQAITER